MAPNAHEIYRKLLIARLVHAILKRIGKTRPINVRYVLHVMNEPAVNEHRILIDDHHLVRYCCLMGSLGQVVGVTPTPWPVPSGQ